MRYSQLVGFKEIGEKGQKELQKKTVALVGLGNIGSTVAVMLLRSGINIRFIDKGRCSINDSSSQLIYLEEDDTRFKAKQAKKRLEQINPKVKIRTFHEDLTEQNIFIPIKFDFNTIFNDDEKTIIEIKTILPQSCKKNYRIIKIF